MVKSETSKLTLGQLIAGLTPAQLWGLLAAIIALILGVFTAGSQMTAYRLERQRTELDAARGDLRSYRVTNDFLVKYLRYMITLRQTQTDGYGRYTEAYEGARTDLVVLIKGWYSRQGDTDPNITLVPSIHKDLDPSGSHVTLPDHTTWPIPIEVKELVVGRKAVPQGP